MERMTGLDASFLYLETDTQLLHVCALIVLDPVADGAHYEFAALKAELGRRLHLVPSMRRHIHRVPFDLDHPRWVEDAHFDLDYHVRRIGIPAPGGRRELAELVADIAGRALDRSRPLWQMWVVEGLEGGRVAVISKYHHAAVDGITGTQMMMALCDLEPNVRYPEPEPGDRITESDPNDLLLAAEGLLRLPGKLGAFGMLPKTLGMVGGFVRRRANAEKGMAIPFTAPRTPFNATISPHRSVAFTTTGLGDIKEIKAAFGVKVNDVVLAVVAGALRGYLEEHGELPDSSLFASVPVSTHATSRHDRGINKVSTLFCRLYTDVADPVERLRLIAEANLGAKQEHDLIGADFLQDWAKYAPPNTFQLAARVYSSFKLAERHPVVHNLVISNVPGPQAPLYFLGYRIDAMYPFGPVFHGAGLNVTVLSVGGSLDFGFIACRELVPDLSAMADEVHDAVGELLKAARDRG
ncbi:wax ester/triacylglycerol synthase family O-acyltransferase [Nocardia sp. CDC159]|uniref:Diacylglycerol O-acyltransferase n=1 Tax=Nocardia pulmonis TaxID=2951408 RepID=A0A9X2E1K5_9NOCA|nr:MULTISPECIES: wax ester/triacylglycerol synthase family O-acyltransferase [Nocardia]MCM6772159.1 wax ester/triacylglycerol synthase family O-acyltransferase [Nocardia pulmonis]MCM6785183.1 wax ester/triacylglycerol synthase family O-acyltransferase [Nocardia sp. CDC159]